MTADLDYAKVIGRFGLTVGDTGTDPDDDPDTVWCTEGRVIITPLNTFVKVAGGSPVPWTGGNAQIECAIDANGYLTYTPPGGTTKQFVEVVDLTSSKVNPQITTGATHRVTFADVKSGMTPVAFPTFTCRLTAAGDGVSGAGINDLTIVAPIVPGEAQPITRGPQGVSIESLAVNGLGELEVQLDDGTTVNAGDLPVGPGGSDAGVAGYLATPASASRAALDDATADLLDDPTSAVAIKTSASFAPLWKPSTAYPAGAIVTAPDGSIVSRLTAGTSGSTYTSTNWTPAPGFAAAVAQATQTAQLQSQMLSFSKGGSIGTSGKIPVALRFDDWQDNMKTSGTVTTDLFNRGLYGSLALCSQLGSQTWNDDITWTDILNWNRNYGMEAWSHGTDHNSPYSADPATFTQNLVTQIITSKQTIEAQGIKCVGFAMPGVPAPGYGSFLLSPADWDTQAGRMLMSTYPLVETDMTSSYRNVPSTMRYGLGHFTISDSGVTLQQAKDALDRAITMGKGIEFMVHVGQLDVAGNMGYANFRLFLDYIVTKRDAGLIEFVAPSSLPFCDPSHSRRLDLLTNGDLTLPVTTNYVGEGGWQGVNGTNRIVTSVTDGPGGGTENVLRITAGSVFATQQINHMIGTGVAGSTFLFDFYARGVGGSSGIRIGAQASNVADLDYKQAAVAVTTSWARKRYAFTVPPTLDAMSLLFGMGFGSSTTVEFARMHVLAA